ncbi:MAG: DUF4258 domain-containing protein [Nitrososphaeria archaeon]
MEKPIKITLHTRRRMLKYGLEEETVVKALRAPDYIVEGAFGRKIAHKSMDDLILRVIYEDNEEIIVVTVYPARKKRYAETV